MFSRPSSRMYPHPSSRGLLLNNAKTTSIYQITRMQRIERVLTRCRNVDNIDELVEKEEYLLALQTYKQNYIDLVKNEESSLFSLTEQLKNYNSMLLKIMTKYIGDYYAGIVHDDLSSIDYVMMIWMDHINQFEETWFCQSDNLDTNIIQRIDRIEKKTRCQGFFVTNTHTLECEDEYVYEFTKYLQVRADFERLFDSYLNGHEEEFDPCSFELLNVRINQLKLFHCRAVGFDFQDCGIFL